MPRILPLSIIYLAFLSLSFRVLALQFSGERYLCIGEIQQKILTIFQNWFKYENIGYADPATYVNLGEHILWLGSIKMMERLGKLPIFYCGGASTLPIGKVFPQCTDMVPEIVSKLSHNRGVLYYSPGGNWGDLYHNVQSARLKIMEIAALHNITFVTGPNAISYKKSKFLEEDDNFIELHARKEHLFTFRQRDSYDFALKRYGDIATIALSPDMSFMVGPQIRTRPAIYDVFVVARNDKETAMKKVSNDICPAIIAAGFTCIMDDWGTGATLHRGKSGNVASPLFAEISLQIAVADISQGAIIISDRLHAAVVAYLTGIPIIYVDTAYGKVHQTFQTAFNRCPSCGNFTSMGIAKSTPADAAALAISWLKANKKSMEEEEAEGAL